MPKNSQKWVNIHPSKLGHLGASRETSALSLLCKPPPAPESTLAYFVGQQSSLASSLEHGALNVKQEQRILQATRLQPMLLPGVRTAPVRPCIHAYHAIPCFAATLTGVVRQHKACRNVVGAISAAVPGNSAHHSSGGGSACGMAW